MAEIQWWSLFRGLFCEVQLSDRNTGGNSAMTEASLYVLNDKESVSPH